MKRRVFLESLAAGGVVAGSSFGAPLVWTRDRDMRQRAEWDLIVLGAGTAGMPAAIFAAQAGARVLVIEATSQLGGTLDRSTGQVSGSQTVWQRTKGIEDSPQAHYADHMRINRSTSDPELTRLFVEQAPATLNWLAGEGFTVLNGDPVRGKGHDPFLVARYQSGPERGRSLLKAMQPAFEREVASGRITIRHETSAVELIVDARGTVRGVVVESGGRREDCLGARVLIATGGCAANPTMFADLHGVPLTTASARPSSQGQGLLLALGVGGVLRGGEKYVPLYGTLLDGELMPAGQDGSFQHDPERRPPWEIHVNARGQRFVREDHPSHEHRQQALARQPGHRLWVVFDSAILDAAPSLLGKWNRERVDAAFRDGHPMFTRAETLSTLALRAGIDPQGLRQSVETYNLALRAGAADPLGRLHRPLPLGTGAWHAIRMSGWTVMSFAGISVDSSLRVLRADGQVVPNLFAAGEALGAGALSGNAYTNGSMVTSALALGRLMGLRALQA